MMYSDKIVVAIKVNGRILRESGEVVTLPFGSEYSILLKNLNSVRAQVAVSVDGTDAAGRLVIAPNSSLELERFIRNGNLQAGNRFKFIERTAEVEGHRGIGSDDGLIRVEAWREHVQKFVDVPVPRYYDEWYPVPPPYYPPWPRPRRVWMSRAGPSGSPQMRGQNTNSGQQNQQNATFTTSSYSAPIPDSLERSFNAVARAPGITVAGSESNQQFHYVSDFALEPQSVVLVLRLRGQVGSIPVSEPVTVAAKPECSTCGRTNKATSQFCSQCGTALVLV